MDLEDQYEKLLSEITKQEEIIENYASKLEEEGNIDPSIEEYLFTAREELRLRKEKLNEEFKPKNIIIEVEDRKSDPFSPEESPRAKFKANTPKIENPPTEKFPLYSVQRIEVSKSPSRPVNIFKKVDQPRKRSTSSSRYTNSPAKSLENGFKSQETGLKKTDEVEKDCLSDCSLESINEKLSSSNMELSVFKSSQGPHISNPTYEKILETKEKLLAEKEKKLDSLMKLIGNNNVSSKRGEIQQKQYKLLDVFPEKIKPPLTPKARLHAFSKSPDANKFVKVTQSNLLYSLSGMDRKKISSLNKVLNSKNPPCPFETTQY